MTDVPPPPAAPPPSAVPPPLYAAPYGSPPGSFAAPPPGAPMPVAPMPGYPVPPGYYPVRQPTNVLAIVSLVLALMALWIVPIVGSIAAIILAVQARKQILVSHEQGGGLATAGLVVGWVGLGLWVLGGIAYFAFIIAMIGMSAATY